MTSLCMSTKTNKKRLSVVISQPMFLPWRGMFEQIKLCDKFIFYDDVQLPLGGGRGRGFTTRVQIKTKKGVEWLSLPVARGGKGKQLICEVVFSNMDWKQLHLNKISEAYRASSFFDEVFETVILPIYSIETEFLSEFCVQSMILLSEKMDLFKEFNLSSKLDVSNDPDASTRVLDYCNYFGANEYISGLGAMNYINYSIFENAGIDVGYMDYKLSPYPQLHGEFTPYVSIIDMLFNIGVSSTAKELNSKSVYWREWPYMKDGRPVSSA